MTEKDYLNRLEQRLARLDKTERDEVLADYAEHFAMGREKGLDDRVIAQKLGSPAEVAQSILESDLSDRSSLGRLGFYLRAVLTFIALSPFNFLVFIGPFLIISIFLLIGWTVPVIVAVSLISAAALSSPLIATLSVYLALSLAFFAIGAVCSFVLYVFFMLWITEGVFKLIYSYIQWNRSLILPRLGEAQ